jgi:hypothetical protein
VVINLGTGRGSKIWIAESMTHFPQQLREAHREAENSKGEFQLVSPLHVTMGLVAKLPKLKVAWHHGSILINGRPIGTENDPVLNLVVKHGLREKAAREIVDKVTELRTAKDPTYTCWVKYAGPYLTERQPGAPPFPDPYMTTEPTLTGSVPGMPWQYYQQPVTVMRPDPSNLAKHDIRVPPPNLLNEVQQAAQSGSKEVFDTSMIGLIPY